MKEIVDSVDVDASLDILRRMIRHKSYSDTPGEVELARFMHATMRDLGLDAALCPVEKGRFNAIGRLPGTGDGKSLIFNGHIDTNPVTGGWTVDPFAGHMDDTFIYGIGVSNMKAGDAAYLCAVRTLIEQGIRLKGDVTLTYVVGELQGGVGTHRLMQDGLRADYFVNAEPTDLGALTLHAGSFNFVIELHGITRHVSKREEAVDAIAVAAELVPAINAMQFSGAKNSEHQSVNRANVGVIRGALTPQFEEWRPPQIADFVRMSGTCRYAPSQSIASCLEDLRRLLDLFEAKHPGLRATVEVLGGHDRPRIGPFEVDRNAPIVRSINAAYALVRGREQPTGPLRPPCFFGTDAAHLQTIGGMEGIVCGPGGKYNTMPDERVEIADFVAMIKIYIATMLDVCGRA